MNGRERRLSSLLSTWARLLLHRLLPPLDQFHEGPSRLPSILLYHKRNSNAAHPFLSSFLSFHLSALSLSLSSSPDLISPIGDLIGYYRVSTGGNSLITSPPGYNRIQTGFGETRR